MLCVLGLAYAALLGRIWIDTLMRPSLIAEAYRGMSDSELVSHSFEYLTWFAVTFSAVLGAFQLSSYRETWKAFFAVWTPFWIVSDIGAAWLIRVHDAFAYALLACGIVLAGTFLALFLLVQRDIWRRHEKG